MDLNQILSAYDAMPDADREEALAAAMTVVGDTPFIPNKGPQTEAYFSQADICLYGGQAGGGKTALEVGLAAMDHHTGIIFRREATQLDGLISFSHEVFRNIPDASYNKVEKIWTWGEGRTLKFAGLNQADDWRKHAGNARDYMAFDEAGEFMKAQIFSLIGWLRTTRPGQRCRILLGSNPPRGGDGQWMVDEFDPWLRAHKTKRAKPGELRWAIVVKDKTEWVDGPGTYERNGEEYEAMSRTFIPASLDDNQFVEAGYRARLQSLPEPLRSQLLYGDFTAGTSDNAFQMIPTQWIREAQERWTPEPPEHAPMSCLAVDIAQGGEDTTMVSTRYDGWFSELSETPGAETPTGNEIAGLVIANRRNSCSIVLDMGGGYGGAAMMRLKDNNVEGLIGHKGAEATPKRTLDQQFGFTNVRSMAYWRLREALDPAQDGGSSIALPDDPQMLSDLTAVRYEITSRGIKATPKDKVVELLGRSPDRGDAITMCNLYGPKLMTHGNQWRKYSSETGVGRKPVNVIMGHKAARRRR